MLENDLLKTFTITHTDFIREGNTSIQQVYKFLNPPLGKGE